MALHQKRKSKIEQLALKTLRDSKCFQAGVDLKKLLKKLDVRLIEQSLNDEISGYSVVRDDVKVIAINTNHADSRQRFTIAHELGHLLLHDFGDFHYKEKEKTFYRNDVSSKGMDISEIEANYFAANLLMPKLLIEEKIEELSGSFLFDESDITSLAEKFKVSSQAMSIRLTSLGIISL